MATNSYINWWSQTNEQDLLSDLMAESIQFYGFDMVYLPRTLQKEDILFNEDVLSKFSSAYTIEGYIDNVQGFSGEQDFLNKFGINVRDRVDFLMSKARFANVVTSIVRPTEGDLIYMPTPFNRLFEIKFVEHEVPFYSLGNQLCWKLSCELFVYSHQDLATGNTTIDALETSRAYALELQLGAGSGTYTVGETVFEGASLPQATGIAVVGSWTANTAVLKVQAIRGAFSNGANVTGVTSGAQYVITATPDTLASANEPVDDNRYIEDQASSILDTNETNPLTE